MAAALRTRQSCHNHSTDPVGTADRIFADQVYQGLISRTIFSKLHRFSRLPEIAVKVLEDCDRPVALFPRWPNKYHTSRLILSEISPEVVRVEKKEYSPAGLIADSR